MTDRRRNLFILLLVAGLLRRLLAVVVADEADAAWASTSRAASRSSTRRSRREFSRGHAPTRSTARSTSCASASTPSASPSRRSSAPAATRSTSRCRTSRTPTRPQQQVGTTAQLFFYDWEKNVLGQDVQAGARRRRGHRRLAGRPAGRRLADLLRARSRAAAKLQADRRAQRHDAGPVLRRRRQGQEGRLRPAGDRGRRARDLRRTQRKRPTARRQGPAAATIVVQAEGADGDDAAKAAGGRRLLRPQGRLRRCAARTSRTPSRTSTAARRHGQPNVTFDFTDSGPQEVAGRRRARSPSAARPRSLPGADPSAGRQHFAIVLDNELISVPYIDFQQNPDGIDGAQRLADLRRLHDHSRPSTSRTCSRPARCRSSSS